MTTQAIIRTQDCIGCTQCIDACPTNAIIGAPQFLHSIIEQDCIGCERCVPACPVDCIDLAPMSAHYDPEQLTDTAKIERSHYIRALVHTHKERLERIRIQQNQNFAHSKNISATRKAYLDVLFNKTNTNSTSK
jgi:electron transport complex protein RnfB